MTFQISNYAHLLTIITFDICTQYAFKLISTAVLYLTEWNGSLTCDSFCTNSFHNLQTCSQRARDFPFTCEKITSITSGFKYGTILLFAFALLQAAATSNIVATPIPDTKHGTY